MNLAARIADSKERIRRLEEQKAKVEADRQLYRDWMIQDLRSYISMLPHGKYFASSTMIETISKRLSKAESFFWG